MRFLIKWFVNIVALLAVIKIIAGISVDSYESLTIAALVIGLLNTFLRPIVIIFTLPFTILTLGIFTLFINGAMLYLASKIVAGFHVANFWSAFWAALLFSIISFLLNILLEPRRKAFSYYRHENPAHKQYKDIIDIDKS